VVHISETINEDDMQLLAINMIMKALRTELALQTKNQHVELMKGLEAKLNQFCRYSHSDFYRFLEHDFKPMPVIDPGSKWKLDEYDEVEVEGQDKVDENEIRLMDEDKIAEELNYQKYLEDKKLRKEQLKKKKETKAKDAEHEQYLRDKALRIQELGQQCADVSIAGDGNSISDDRAHLSQIRDKLANNITIFEYDDLPNPLSSKTDNKVIRDENHVLSEAALKKLRDLKNDDDSVVGDRPDSHGISTKNPDRHRGLDGSHENHHSDHHGLCGTLDNYDYLGNHDNQGDHRGVGGSLDDNHIHESNHIHETGGRNLNYHDNPPHNLQGNQIPPTTSNFVPSHDAVHIADSILLNTEVLVMDLNALLSVNEMESMSLLSSMDTFQQNVLQGNTMSGRIGERLAFEYLSSLVTQEGSFWKDRVARMVWINRDEESGMPYDIVITLTSGETKYCEVKTRLARRLINDDNLGAEGYQLQTQWPISPYEINAAVCGGPSYCCMLLNIDIDTSNNSVKVLSIRMVGFTEGLVRSIASNQANLLIQVVKT